MPSRPEPTARSSSRSSKSADAAGLVATAPEPDAIPVGAVADAHALRGLLRVRPYDVATASLEPGASILLEDGTRWFRTRVTSSAPHGRGFLLVGVEGVADRTAAEGWRGARIRVSAGDLPPCEEGEFYWHEVVGFAVETIAGVPLGTIAETMATGLNDVWVVRDGTREVLIPVIADVVRSIDRAGRRVVIEPMPGLLE